MNAEEQAVRALHVAWIEAVNAADLARLLGWMTDDVVLLNPGQAPLGRDGFSAGFLGAHQQYRLRCESELEEVVVVGALAYTRSHDTVTVTPHAGGATTRHAGYRLTLYRQQPDGRWLLARDAHNLAPVAA